MDNYLLISIIIPVYNIKDYLPFCLDCLLAQTYTNYEIILIDDGSTDGTSDVCDVYASCNKKIKAIHKDNEGQSIARNLGIDMSSGDLITFIDGDDWVEKNYLEVLYKALTSNDADIVNCNFIRTRSRTPISDIFNKAKFSITFDSEAAIENLCYLKDLNCAPYCKLFRRHLWDNIRFPEHEIYEDLAVIYKTFDLGSKIIYIDYDGYYYYQRVGSSLNTHFDEKKLSRVRFSEEILNFIKHKYPSITNAGYCRLFWSSSGALMDLPWKYDNLKIYTTLDNHIKECRKHLLLDNNCKASIRFLAVLSLLGVRNYKFVLSIYQKYFKRN